MSGTDAPRTATAGDRAVAIAGFLAILLTGFFGDEPVSPQDRSKGEQPRAPSARLDWVRPQPAPSAVPSAQR
jgi:hypothetical protein